MKLRISTSKDGAVISIHGRGKFIAAIDRRCSTPRLVGDLRSECDKGRRGRTLTHHTSNRAQKPLEGDRSLRYTHLDATDLTRASSVEQPLMDSMQQNESR